MALARSPARAARAAGWRGHRRGAGGYLLSGHRRGLGLGSWIRRRRGDDLEDLCRALRLDGWELLPNRGGAVLLTPGDPAARVADWQVIARAIAAWAGPLVLLDPGIPVDRQRLAAGGIEGPMSRADAALRLARGEKVLILSAEPETDPASRFGHNGEAPVLTATLSTDPDGRRRLVIRRAEAG